MAGLKLSSIILSIGLGAALLTPLSASAQGPEQQFEKDKLQYEANVMKTKASTSVHKLNTNDAVDNPIFVYDHQYSDKSAMFYWFYPNVNVGSHVSFRILLNGNEIATVKSPEYIIKNSLLASTDYKVTIQVLKNGKLTGEETNLSFTTYALPSGEVVTLKDTNLENAVKDQLLIDDRPLYESDFEHLTSLIVYPSEITSLDGLERAVNLEVLMLPGGSISDISPLTPLKKLTYLDLSWNQLTNIDNLLYLDSLENVALLQLPLDLSKGSSARKVVDQLKQKGVEVYHDTLGVTKQVASDKAFGIAWTNYDDMKPDYYKVSYGDGNSGIYSFNEVETTRNSIFLTGLKPDTEYTLNIVAFKGEDSLGSLLVTIHTSTAANVNGWVQVGEDQYFYNKDKGTLEKGWLKSGTTWYFMDDTGAMTTGWAFSGGKWYFMNETGAMATGWIKIGGKWYLLDSNGAMKTGWVNSGGKWYFMNESGSMAAGWVKTGGKWYFMNESGAMVTGWMQSSGKWYFMNESGAMATGWVKTGGKWYFMNESGTMVTGWVKTGGSWYYLDQSGAMVTGWVQSGSKWYYLKTDGKMAYSTMIGNYKLGPDGAWIK